MDQNQDLLRRLLEAESAAREAIEERNAAREERDAEKAAREAAEDAARVANARIANAEEAARVANARIANAEEAVRIAGLSAKRNAEVNYAAAEANFPMYGFSVYVPYLKLGCREQALTAYNHCRNRGT